MLTARVSEWWPRYVRPYPAEQVTSRNVAAEVAPRDVGLRRATVDSIWDAVVRLYGTGLHPAIALNVRHRGQVILDRAIGHLRGNAPDDPPDAPKVPVRHDSLFTLFSASKAVTAMLVQLLEQRGAIRIDHPVAEYLPEFARNGKDRITIRQILTHRAGLPTVRGVPPSLDLLADWERVIEILCEAEPLHAPGTKVTYHAITGGFLLGEIVRRVSGKDVRTFLRDEICAPLGLSSLDYGAPPSRHDDLAHNAYTGAPPLPPFSWLLSKSFGVPFKTAVELSNDPRFYRCPIPSGNVTTTADEACRFFELLRSGGELDGVRVFHPETVRRAVEPRGVLELDAGIGLPIEYGLGFMLGNPVVGLYGRNAPRAFGHIGFSAVLVWADPDRALSACLMTSGKPLVTLGQLRWLDVIYTIARHVPRV